MRVFLAAIMMLWAIPAIAAFTQFSVNGGGAPTPPANTPTYYLYGF